MRIAAIPLCLFAAVSSAATRTTTLSRFESSAILNRDGSAVIVEEIDSPGPLTAFERAIRVRSAGPLGSQHHLMVRVLEVSDGAGHRLAYHTRFDGDDLRIHAPSPGHTLKITYALWNPVRFFGDHDEFFWPVNPPDAAIVSTLFRITLPSAAAGQFATQGFLRATSARVPDAALWSSSGRVPMASDGTMLTLVAPGPLVPGVTMVADVFVAKGIFREPSAAQQIGWFVRSNPIVLLPVIVALAMLLLRVLKGGNSAARRSVAPMYGPPEGLTPAEVGVLIDDCFDPRDVVATLIDLAVRGYVRIEECVPEPGTHDRDFIVRLLKPMPEWNGLARHEYTMLFHTFYGGHWTKLSSLRLRFYSVVPIMRDQVLQALRAKRLYRVDPQQAHVWRVAAMVMSTGVIVLAHYSGLISLFDSPLLAAVMIAASAAITTAMSHRMTAKTRRGMRAYVALLGLQDFISTVDGDRLQRAESVSFEKLLPYAMALGLEHRLAHAFGGIATASPDWYVWADAAQPPSAVCDSILFSHQLDQFAQQTRGMLNARPRGKVPHADSTPTAARALIRSAGA